MASTGVVVNPIATHSVVQQVTAELRRSILSGRLRPGQEFGVRTIADSMQVSLVPVREALRSLESEGLIQTRRNKSAVVSPIDLDDLRSIYRIRRNLEPEIASRSCLLLSDDELIALEGEVHEFGDESRGLDDIYESHGAFHMSLMAPAASAWDVRILNQLWNASERYIRIGFGRLDPQPAEHRRRGLAHQSLVDAFRQRSPYAAASAVREHLDHNEQLAMHALRSID